MCEPVSETVDRRRGRESGRHRERGGAASSGSIVASMATETGYPASSTHVAIWYGIAGQLGQAGRGIDLGRRAHQAAAFPGSIAVTAGSVDADPSDQ